VEHDATAVGAQPVAPPWCHQKGDAGVLYPLVGAGGAILEPGLVTTCRERLARLLEDRPDDAVLHPLEPVHEGGRDARVLLEVDGRLCAKPLVLGEDLLEPDLRLLVHPPSPVSSPPAHLPTTSRTT